MDRIPDYIGNWAVDGDPKFEHIPTLVSLGFGRFELFIDEKIKTNGITKIKGIITDYYGEATFEGELEEKTIRFVKRYNKEIVESGKSVDEIPYEGQKIKEGFYKGTYNMKGGQKGNPNEWNGQFVLFVNPEIN